MFILISERDGIQRVGFDKRRQGDNFWVKVRSIFVARVERGNFRE